MGFVGYLATVIIALGFVGGAALWLFIQSRGRRETYIAKCYQLSSGIIPNKLIVRVKLFQVLLNFQS